MNLFLPSSNPFINQFLEFFFKLNFNQSGSKNSKKRQRIFRDHFIFLK